VLAFSLMWNKLPTRTVFALVLGSTLSLAVNGCSAKQTPTPPPPPVLEQYPLEAPPLQNCRFQNPNPVYSLNQPIQIDQVLCDQGVPLSSQVLNATPLPTGILFDSSTLQLVGTPSTTTSHTLYQVYLENSAGYVIIPLQITVQ